MKHEIFALVAGVALASTTPVGAHHSFAATYLSDKEVKIEGRMVQFLFRNPHSFVQVEAADENGQMVLWSIEWAAAGQLKGVRQDTLKYGDHVIVTGNPGRAADDHRIEHFRQLDRRIEHHRAVLPRFKGK